MIELYHKYDCLSIIKPHIANTKYRIYNLGKGENAMELKMKVSNLYGIGDLRYEEKDIPKCCDDEVLVKVKICGICGSDIGRILRTGTYHFPTVPGHEFAGRVVYDKEDKLTGKRVAVFPLIPCNECEMCKVEKYAQCSNYNYYGSRCDGGYAEYVAVKKWNLVNIPDNVSYEEAAMCEPTSVALHAIQKLEIKGGENILITGAGPIGIIAGMWAKSYGAKEVYYIDIDVRKIEFCKNFGFKEYNKNADEIDVVLEGTGASSAVANAISAVKPSGRLVFMGNPSGDVTLAPKDYQNILRKELKISGTWNSSYASYENNWKESLVAISKKKIDIKRLITHKIPLKDCLKAVKMMGEGKDFYCKVVIDNEG